MLAAVPVVAGFALLRGFLAEPGRRTTVAVVATAGGATTLELLLSGGLNLSVGLARRLAPWVFWPAGVLATVQLGTGWLGAVDPARAATLLHTGLVLGLVALAWFAVARPRGTGVTVTLRVGAALLAVGLVAGIAQAIVLRPVDPTPGLHVGADGAAVGTGDGDLSPVRPRPGTTGGWVAVQLPAGRSDLRVRYRDRLDSFTTDTGRSAAAPATLTGPDGAECASALLGRMLAVGPVTGDIACPSDTLDRGDGNALTETVAFLAGQGQRRIAVATDQSPRGRAAAATVRAAALDLGTEIVPPGRTACPLLVMSGWAAADAVLRRVADGELPYSAAYLAPWLFTEPLLAIDRQQHIAQQRISPDDELFRRHRAELTRRFPAQLPSADGYRAWLSGRFGPETAR